MSKALIALSILMVGATANATCGSQIVDRLIQSKLEFPPSNNGKLKVNRTIEYYGDVKEALGMIKVACPENSQYIKNVESHAQDIYAKLYNILN